MLINVFVVFISFIGCFVSNNVVESKAVKLSQPIENGGKIALSVVLPEFAQLRHDIFHCYFDHHLYLSCITNVTVNWVDKLLEEYEAIIPKKATFENNYFDREQEYNFIYNFGNASQICANEDDTNETFEYCLRNSIDSTSTNLGKDNFGFAQKTLNELSSLYHLCAKEETPKRIKDCTENYVNKKAKEIEGYVKHISEIGQKQE